MTDEQRPANDTPITVLTVPGNRSECPTCGGTGWRIIQRRDDGLTGAEPCACREVRV